MLTNDEREEMRFYAEAESSPILERSWWAGKLKRLLAHMDEAEQTIADLREENEQLMAGQDTLRADMARDGEQVAKQIFEIADLRAENERLKELLDTMERKYDLDRFCRFAQKAGYLDSDWYAEQPKLIDQYEQWLKENE